MAERKFTGSAAISLHVQGDIQERRFYEIGVWGAMEQQTDLRPDGAVLTNATGQFRYE